MRRVLIAGLLFCIGVSTAVGAGDDPYAGFMVGAQSFSFRSFKLEETIERMQQLGLHNIELCGVHLKQNAAPEEIAAVKKRLASAGIAVPAYGVVRFKEDRDANRRVFEFARALGVATISADPGPESFAQLDELVAEFNIKIAIHNHGPKHRYGTIESIEKAIEGHDKRIGVCVDTGHFIRSNEDPAEAIRRFADRVHEVHLKDVYANDVNAPFGRGRMDTTGVLHALKEIGFKGHLALEHEANPKNPVPDMLECLAFMRDALRPLPSSGRFITAEPDGTMAIRLGGRPVAWYRFSREGRKPYLFPVLGPDGEPITTDKPPDHRHHHSIWIAHDKVNGHDFWHEGNPDRNMFHERFTEIRDQAAPGFTSTTAWVYKGITMLRDRRSFTFRPLDNGEYLIDVEVELWSPGEPVTIGQTKEAGLPAVRVGQGIRVTAGGMIKNSDGRTNEPEVMQQRARWADYCGPRPDGSWAGIAFFVHPGNRGYPPYWFVRDWGWFAANYTLWDKPIELTVDGDGSRFRVRSRLYIHRNKPDQADIPARYNQYLKESTN